MTSPIRLAMTISIVMTALVVAGCASSEGVRVLKPVERETLPQKTFAWAGGGVSQMMPADFGDRTTSVVGDAIIKALMEKGYVPVAKPSRADLIVLVGVDGDFPGEFDRPDRVDLPEADDTGETQYYRRTAARSQETGADRVNAAYDARRDAMLVGAEVQRTLLIGIQDRATRDELWRGQIRKSIKLADVTELESDIRADIAELFADFPVSGGR
ncbi:MAG: DUF4136 domain-containing protein [Alphaproteobacteria bacterium]